MMVLSIGPKTCLLTNEFTGFFKAIVNLNPQFKGESNVQKVKYYPF